MAERNTRALTGIDPTRQAVFSRARAEMVKGFLARSASGENDLDLLVHRYDGQRFAEVLDRLGFRRALAPGVREAP